MRFAWLKKNSPEYEAVKRGCVNPLTLIRIVYNAVFWVFLLPFVTTIDYSTGFIAFAIVVLVRLGANLYANNVFAHPQQFEGFPLRS